MARQNSLNASLASMLRKYVRAKGKSGCYESAGEAIHDSLRALQEREQASASFWTGVRKQVAIARDEVSAGKTVDGEQAMDAIIADLDGGSSRPARRKRRLRR